MSVRRQARAQKGDTLHTPVVCPPKLCGYPIQSGVEVRQELLFGAAVLTSSLW